MAEVRLRPIRMSDAERCFTWVNDPEVARYLGLTQAPATVAEEKAWIGKVLGEKDQQRVFVIEDEEGRGIGTCGLRGIDREAGYALLGIVIGERRRWDRGYGTAATRALVGYAFGELGLGEVRLSCHPSNRRAVRCYEKAGFEVVEGERGEDSLGRAQVRMVIRREQCDKTHAEEEAGHEEE